MKRVNNIILIGAWPPPSGGVASYTQDLYYNLLSKGFKIKIYAKGNFQSNDPNIEKIILSPRNPLNTLLSFYKIFKNTPSGSIIHTQSLLTARPNLFVCLYFETLKLIKHIYLIETLHAGSLPERYNYFNKFQKSLYFIISKILDKLIVTSDLLNQFCIDIKIPQNKIITINSLLPIDYLDIDTNISNEYQSFIKKFPYIITTIGAFIPDYDFKTIVEAFQIFSRKHHDSGLIILETAFQENKKYKEETLKLINNSENILVLHNLLRPQVLGILSQTKIFIRGCKNDSFGLSKAEAIMMGANVITAKAGITQYMFLYRYNDVKNLFSQMESLYTLENDIINSRKTYFTNMAITNLDALINIYLNLK